MAMDRRIWLEPVNLARTGEANRLFCAWRQTPEIRPVCGELLISAENQQFATNTFNCQIQSSAVFLVSAGEVETALVRDQLVGTENVRGPAMLTDGLERVGGRASRPQAYTFRILTDFPNAHLGHFGPVANFDVRICSEVVRAKGVMHGRPVSSSVVHLVPLLLKPCSAGSHGSSDQNDSSACRSNDTRSAEQCYFDGDAVTNGGRSGLLLSRRARELSRASGAGRSILSRGY